MADIKKIGDNITATCPVTGKTQTFVVTGRNFCGSAFHSYMVGNSAYGRCITTVNESGVSAFRLF